MIFFSRGYVLPTMLVLLHLLFLMGLSGSMNVSMLIKSRISTGQKKELLMKANGALRGIEDMLSSGVIFCVVPSMAAAEFSKKPLSWWQSTTCHGNLYQIRYYYAVELLGIDPCGLVQINGNSKQIANFYRITLLALPEKTNDVRIRLQSTMVTTANETVPCQSNLHKIMAGRQMWREI